MSVLKLENYICPPFEGRQSKNQKHFRELSSVGSEQLPYKQRVSGSNPLAPTRDSKRNPFFVMANTYVLHSISLDKYYVGQTEESVSH